MKLTRYLEIAPDDLSHPARGAWVEMAVSPAPGVCNLVAPREGCVG